MSVSIAGCNELQPRTNQNVLPADTQAVAGGPGPNVAQPNAIKRRHYPCPACYLAEESSPKGTVEALEHKLTIGPNGTVHADVKAREVAVLGFLQGDVEATDKIEIRKDAKLVGNIKTARILIEDGAYFKGGIEVVKAEPKAAPEAQPSAPAPLSAGPVAQPVHPLKWTPEGRL